MYRLTRVTFRHLLIDTGYVFLLFILYTLSARLSLTLDAISGFASLFWIPTGIALAALLLFGFRFFPGIALGALVANFLAGAPFLVACGIAIGNTLEAVVGAYLLKRVAHFHVGLERLSDVLGLIGFAAVGSSLVSATVGVTSLSLGGVLSSSYESTWFAWWIGDALSSMIIAPFLLVWSRKFDLKIRFVRLIEAIFLLGAIVLVGVFIFRGLFGREVRYSPFVYIIYPILIWAALRFGQKGSVTATLIFSLIAVLYTVQGFGPFARGSVSESLMFLQSFMGVTAFTFLILAANVAERKKLQERKDEFISFASHELKTPITSLKVFLQMLQRSDLQKERKKVKSYIDHMDGQINKLISLINTMLDVSKMQGSELEIHKGTFSLLDITKEIVESMNPSSKDIVIRYGKRVPSIYADRERIGQVISNFLSNAIKYSPDNKKITITIKKAPDKVIFSIKDYGFGISSEHQTKVFDRYYRVKESDAPAGLGIGLYLSKKIIRLHGGDIWLESKQGKGSTFFFSLPFKTSSSTDSSI